jgi:hypothetical protein
LLRVRINPLALAKEREVKREPTEEKGEVKRHATSSMWLRLANQEINADSVTRRSPKLLRRRWYALDHSRVKPV